MMRFNNLKINLQTLVDSKLEEGIQYLKDIEDDLNYNSHSGNIGSKITPILVKLRDCIRQIRDLNWTLENDGGGY
jgi:hypothetical protein